MIVTDEQITSLTQAFKSLPLVEPRREQSPNHFGTASNSPANGQGMHVRVWRKLELWLLYFCSRKSGI